MNNTCPYCGSRAIDITTSDDLNGFDRRKRFLCIGNDSHEFRDGDGPEPEDEPLIILAR